MDQAVEVEPAVARPAPAGGWRERSEVRRVYLLGAFLVFAYAVPFAVGVSAGTVRLDGPWLANLAAVVLGGVMQGGVYAMFAVGLTLIFGVMRIINAAHGEMVMMGAYLTWVSFFFLGVEFHLQGLFSLRRPVDFSAVLQNEDR
jgi:hypothetical protein